MKWAWGRGTGPHVHEREGRGEVRLGVWGGKFALCLESIEAVAQLQMEGSLIFFCLFGLSIFNF